MLTYFNAFFSGELDPLLTHISLLSGSILAEFAVATGIILESPREKAFRERLGMVLVLGGVIVSAILTISLFMFDEGISRGQQEKIIALESRLAARSLTAPQITDIMSRLSRFSGQTFEIVAYWQDEESLDISNKLSDILLLSDWVIAQPKTWVGLAGVVTGIVVSIDKGSSLKTHGAASALVTALRTNSLAATLGHEINNPKPTDKIEIHVGIKP